MDKWDWTLLSIVLWMLCLAAIVGSIAGLNESDWLPALMRLGAAFTLARWGWLTWRLR